jgi:hypothetical protein
VQHQIERRVQAELGELALCGWGDFQRCAQRTLSPTSLPQTGEGRA